MIQTNLYDFVCYFALTVNGVKTEIFEPSSWDKITNHIPRDPVFHGFTSDFIEDKYGLLFTFEVALSLFDRSPLTGGGQILMDAYESTGPDTEVFFEFGERRRATLIPIKKWRVYLTEYGRDFGGVGTSIEKMPLQGKIRSRQNSPVSLNQFQNFDKNTLTPISTWQLRLHNKTLQETSISQSTNPSDSNEYFDGGGQIYEILIQPDMSNLVTNELSQVFEQPLGLINTTIRNTDYPGPPLATQRIPFTDLICQYTAHTSGSLNVDYSGQCDFWWWEDNVNIASWIVTPRVVVQRLIGGVQTIIGIVNGTGTAITGTAFPVHPPPGILPSISGAVIANSCSFLGYTWGEHFTDIQILAGDNVYIQLYMKYTFTQPLVTLGLGIQIASYTNDVTLTQLTNTPASTCNGYRIFDVLTQMVECCTGQKNAVISEFFSEGGPGYNYLLTSGYGIRNFGRPGFGFKQALQQILVNLQAVFCIGVGFRTIGDFDYMVVENVKDFYKNRIIGTYKNSFGWKDVHNNAVCYNQAELGFNKYAINELKMIDEFCVDGSFLLQTVKTQSNILSKKSAFIASGYTIELQRRNQFLQNPGENLPFDDDIFLIATHDSNLYTNVTLRFDGASAIYPWGGNSIILWPDTQAFLQGDQILFTVGIWAGLTFTIYGEVPGYPLVDGHDAYYCYETIPVGTWTTSNDYEVLAPPSFVFAEKSEPFDICMNVINPQTIYNGRLSVKHILYNWSPVLAVGMNWINPGSVDFSVSQIFTTMPKMNNQFTTKYRAAELNKGYVGNRLMMEIDNVNASDYLQDQAIYTPKGGEVKIYIGWNEFMELTHALCGELGDDTKDHGGIVVNDDLGRFWFVHVMDMQHDPVQQIASLKVQKVRQVWVT